MALIAIILVERPDLQRIKIVSTDRSYGMWRFEALQTQKKKKNLTDLAILVSTSVYAVVFIIPGGQFRRSWLVDCFRLYHPQFWNSRTGCFMAFAVPTVNFVCRLRFFCGQLSLSLPSLWPDVPGVWTTLPTCGLLWRLSDRAMNTSVFSSCLT